MKDSRRKRDEDFGEGKEGGRECEEGRNLKEEELGAVRRVLFGAMVLERILGLYVGCNQDAVWDVWDHLDYLDGVDLLNCDSLDYF